MAWIFAKFTRPTRIQPPFVSETLSIYLLISFVYYKLWKFGLNLSISFQIIIRTAQWSRYHEGTHQMRYAHRVTFKACLFCLGKFMGCFSEVKGSDFVVLTRLQALSVRETFWVWFLSFELSTKETTPL